MKRTVKILSLILAFSLIFSAFALPASAAIKSSGSGYSAGENIEHRFYQILDVFIDILGKFLNTTIPGYNWTGDIPSIKNHTTADFYPGKEKFDTQPAEGAKWSMGFSAKSFLTNIDPTDGSYYISGDLGLTEGNVPTQVLDDQGVNTYAISDGTTTVTYSAIDGFGLTRGDVLEVRKRLADFAEKNGIVSINVSSIHQHSCIDTLGLGVPVLPALVKNPWKILFKQDDLVTGKNEAFMEEFYNAVTASVIEAVENMTEGKLFYGNVDISEHIDDKRDPQSFDGNFNRLRFVPDDTSKNEIWICETGMHPVTIGSSSHALSSDFPYYIEQYVKENNGADLVFIQGAQLAISSHANTFDYDPDDGPNARAKAMGKTLGAKLISITEEEELPALLNIAFTEFTVDVDNPIHILAAREGLLSSVIVRNKLGYSVITELGYMELGGKLGIALVPGEIEPAILWGGAATAEESWNGKTWDYDTWANICGAEKLLCFGLCNDQIGYILCDNDYRSMLTENEEVNAVSKTAGSTVTEAFTALIAKVK